MAHKYMNVVSVKKNGFNNLKTNKIMKNKLIYGYILGLLTSLVVMILVNLLK